MLIKKTKGMLICLALAFLFFAAYTIAEPCATGVLAELNEESGWEGGKCYDAKALCSGCSNAQQCRDQWIATNCNSPGCIEYDYTYFSASESYRINPVKDNTFDCRGFADEPGEYYYNGLKIVVPEGGIVSYKDNSFTVSAPGQYTLGDYILILLKNSNATYFLNHSIIANGYVTVIVDDKNISCMEKCIFLTNYSYFDISNKSIFDISNEAIIILADSMIYTQGDVGLKDSFGNSFNSYQPYIFAYFKYSGNELAIDVFRHESSADYLKLENGNLFDVIKEEFFNITYINKGEDISFLFKKIGMNWRAARANKLTLRVTMSPTLTITTEGDTTILSYNGKTIIILPEINATEISVRNISCHNCSEFLIPCTDSDGGKNYAVKGRTGGYDMKKGRVAVYVDSCNGTDNVMEYYCEIYGESPSVAMENHFCGDGYACEDGACIVKSALPPQASGEGGEAPPQQESPSKSCSECGEGLFNVCGRDECLEECAGQNGCEYSAIIGNWLGKCSDKAAPSGAGGGGEAPQQQPGGTPATGGSSGGGAGGTPPATTGSGNLPQPKTGECKCTNGTCTFTGSNCNNEGGITCPSVEWTCAYAGAFMEGDVEPFCCAGGERCVRRLGDSLRTCTIVGYQGKQGQQCYLDSQGGYCDGSYCGQCSVNNDCAGCSHCGDRKVDLNEECDAIDTNNDGINDQAIYKEDWNSCSDYVNTTGERRPFKGGTLSCTENCRVDTSGCFGYEVPAEGTLICVRGSCQNPNSKCVNEPFNGVLCESDIYFSCTYGSYLDIKDNPVEPNCCVGGFCFRNFDAAYYCDSDADCKQQYSTHGKLCYKGSDAYSYQGKYFGEYVDGVCGNCKTNADCARLDPSCGNGIIEDNVMNCWDG